MKSGNSIIRNELMENFYGWSSSSGTLRGSPLFEIFQGNEFTDERVRMDGKKLQKNLVNAFKSCADKM